MKGKIFKFWNRLRSSFWFIPTLMASVAVALALVSVRVDQPITDWLELNLGWTFTGGAEGASAVLGIIAGSMITIAGVVFSMTLVALSLASSQLGPRLLRSFMRDTTTQVVLGTFVATFLYCLVVLSMVRRGTEFGFVPHLSVTFGVLLAAASVGVFIYFIHHVSISIQANEVAAKMGKELIHGVDRLFPVKAGQETPKMPIEPPGAGFLAAFEQEARAVGANGDGYLQFIDQRALFALNQLVEIAVRALSTGVNDPFTAITCVDHLGSALCRLASRDMPPIYCYDDQDQLRVIGSDNTFPKIIDAAFNQIRQHSRTDTAVTVRLLETIAVVVGFTHQSEDRDALLRHAEMIARGAREGLPEEQDRLSVAERLQAVRKLCSGDQGDLPIFHLPSGQS